MKQYVVKLRKLFPQFYTGFFVFDVTFFKKGAANNLRTKPENQIKNATDFRFLRAQFLFFGSAQKTFK